MRVFPAILMTVLVVGLWAFPRVWYTRSATAGEMAWLSEQTEIGGWKLKPVPVSESAEKVLVADRLVNAEFSAVDGRLVRVFSAKRYEEKSDDIGLFVHTPDRCWTEAGWKMDPVSPDHVEVLVQGLKIGFERRVFAAAGRRELVYFGGLVKGQPLPYRLDHNLSVGMRHALRVAPNSTGTSLRASDSRFWQRVLDSFLSRSPLLGPKQFVRVSTPVVDAELAGADALLVDFLGKWLKVADYHQELETWRETRGRVARQE